MDISYVVCDIVGISDHAPEGMSISDFAQVNIVISDGALTRSCG